MPIKNITHHIRDFFQQFEGFRDWINKIKLTPIIVFGFIGIGLIAALFYSAIDHLIYLLRFSNYNNYFFIFSFIGLGIISYLQGWNHSLYSPVTFEYSTLLIFPIVKLWESIKKPNLCFKFIVGICLINPIISNANFFQITNLFSTKISCAEKDLGLSNSRFSEAIEVAEKRF